MLGQEVNTCNKIGEARQCVQSMGPRIVLNKLHLQVSMHSSSNRKEDSTLHEFLHPPPLSSVGFGGFHFHVHSNVTDGLPPVE